MLFASRSKPFRIMLELIYNVSLFFQSYLEPNLKFLFPGLQLQYELIACPSA